jgi:hypothetical protein
MHGSTGRRKEVLSAFVVLLGAAMSGPLKAQQGLREQIVGTWTVSSQYVLQDATRVEPFGANPKGMAVYDNNGRFIFVLQRASLPRFASANRMTGTPEENKAVVQGSIAYYGRYSINEQERKIALHF